MGGKPQIVGGIFSEPDVKPAKPGPKTELDATLEGQRSQLVWVLENNWADIGYGLSQSSKASDLHAVFSSLTEPWRDRLRLFWRPSTKYAKSRELYRLRKRYGELVKESRAACEMMQKAEGSLLIGRSALQQSEGTDQQRSMEHECARRTATFAEAQRHSAVIEEQLQNYRNDIEDKEAGFAQAELLDFVEQRRYAITPLNVANAIVGLPYMAWRQSFKRCIKWPCEMANGLLYRQFKLIDSAFCRFKVETKSPVERMRLFLQRKFKKNKDDAALQLKKNWYYLQKAIEQVHEEGHAPEAVPFRVFSAFMKRQASATNPDRILAEEQQLW